MALLVQKYGGTSVASVERIGAVADRVARSRAAGHRVAVVVSAMAGETDRLLGLASAIRNPPRGRELDVVLASGEQASIGLVAMALEARGCPACSYTGAQVRIRTDSAFNRARIRDIDGDRLRSDLDAGRVVVVAGFQGVDEAGSITTLGRGGSDTTGVALAVALGADECQIYSDVDGVYTADPRIVPNARRLDRLTFEEMLELASLGAKVLQIRAMEFASKYRVPLRVLSSFEDGPGTMIVPEEEGQGMEQPLISGVAFTRDEAKITVHRVPDRPGVAFRLLQDIAGANIEVDMIVQNVAPEHDQTDFTFNCAPQRLRAGPRAGRPGGGRARSGAGHRGRPHRQALPGRGGNAFARRHREPDVRGARRRERQHPDDLDVGDQDLGGGRRALPRARRARPARGIRAARGLTRPAPIVARDADRPVEQIERSSSSAMKRLARRRIAWSVPVAGLRWTMTRSAPSDRMSGTERWPSG